MTTSSEATDVDDKFDVLMDANDHILEKVVRKDMPRCTYRIPFV